MRFHPLLLGGVPTCYVLDVARREISGVEGASFAGERVAVACNRHKCVAHHPVVDGEHSYPVRFAPRSGSPVQGYAERLWLCDVSFFVSPSGLRAIRNTGSRSPCCFVVGTVLHTRPSKPRAKDWSEILFNPFKHGCFFEAESERCVRGAKYARLENRTIYAMGLEYGEPVTSSRELKTPREDLPVYNPARDSWTGDMGGLNFEPASKTDISRELEMVWSDFPGAIVIDGTDDWNAPEHVRPERFAYLFDVKIHALWHTGSSGKTSSGIVISLDQYDILNARYRRSFGMGIMDLPSVRRPGRLSRCRCWDGSAFRVYTDPSTPDGHWTRSHRVR